MRIVLFSALYPPHMGGVERFTEQLSRTLVSMGHSVCVVTNDTESLGAAVSSESGVEILRLDCLSLMDGRFPLRRLSGINRRLIKHIYEFRPNAAVINTRFYPHSLFALRLSKRLNIPALVIDHGSYWLSFGTPVLDLFAQLYERIITYIGRTAFNPIYAGISSKSVQWLRTLNVETNYVIGNAINADSFRLSASDRDYRKELGLPSGSHLIVSVGRLIPEKGIPQMLEALDSSFWKDKNAALLIAGSGPLEERVVSAQSEHCRYLGRLCSEDIAALFSQASILLLPSVSEGFATTLLEAASCSLPSLVTDVGGVKEIYGDDYEYILPHVSSSSILEYADMMLSQPARLLSVGEEAYSNVRTNYDWNSVADRIVSILTSRSVSGGLQ